MRKEGILLICDRCGKAVLLEKLDDYNNYEDPPEGWTQTIGSELCDRCSRNLEGVIDKFWREFQKKEVHL